MQNFGAIVFIFGNDFDWNFMISGGALFATPLYQCRNLLYNICELRLILQHYAPQWGDNRSLPCKLRKYMTDLSGHSHSLVNASDFVSADLTYSAKQRRCIYNILVHRREVVVKRCIRSFSCFSFLNPFFSLWHIVAPFLWCSSDSAARTLTAHPTQSFETPWGEILVPWLKVSKTVHKWDQNACTTSDACGWLKCSKFKTCFGRTPRS